MITRPFRPGPNHSCWNVLIGAKISIHVDGQFHKTWVLVAAKLYFFFFFSDSFVVIMGSLRSIITQNYIVHGTFKSLVEVLRGEDGEYRGWMVGGGDLTGGEHTLQCAGDGLWNCASETCVIVSTSVTPISSMKSKKHGILWVRYIFSIKYFLIESRRHHIETKYTDKWRRFSPTVGSAVITAQSSGVKLWVHVQKRVNSSSK